MDDKTKALIEKGKKLENLPSKKEMVNEDRKFKKLVKKLNEDIVDEA